PPPPAGTRPPATPQRPGSTTLPSRPPYRGAPPRGQGQRSHSGHRPPTVKHPAPKPSGAASGRPEGVSASAETAKSALKKLQVSSMVTVRELAEKMEVKPNDLIK